MKAKVLTQHNSSDEERKVMEGVLACIFDALSDPDSEFYKKEE